MRLIVSRRECSHYHFMNPSWRSVCQRASNAAGVEFTRSGIQSFAPDIMWQDFRILPHRGRRDGNVQKSDNKMTTPKKKKRVGESCESGMSEPKLPIIRHTCLTSVPQGLRNDSDCDTNQCPGSFNLSSSFFICYITKRSGSPF